MGKTKALREALRKELLLFCANTYYGDASEQTTFPRLAFELREVFKEDECTRLDLEVNLLDQSRDTAWVEAAADSLQRHLSQFYYLDEEIQFAAYVGGRLIIREDDKSIQRRRLIFEIRLHERRQSDEI